jgi:hypothetical protein
MGSAAQPSSSKAYRVPSTFQKIRVLWRNPIARINPSFDAVSTPTARTVISFPRQLVCRCTAVALRDAP